MRSALHPHRAVYEFQALGAAVGEERAEIARTDDGWRVTSSLQIHRPLPSSTEIDWRLNPDLSSRILYVSCRNEWSEEHELELAITGNGVLASRGAPDGPSQVELGWGPHAELDHLAAVFTTILLARWDMEAEPEREIQTVYIGSDDLVPEPLAQQVRYLGIQDGLIGVERYVAESGTRARLTVDADGVVRTYEGLFTALTVELTG